MKNILCPVLLCLCTAAASLPATAQEGDGLAVKKIVLIAGKPSHGPGEHEFNAGTLLLDKCLQRVEGIETVFVKGGWPEDETVFNNADALFFYMDGGGGHPIIQADHLDTIGRLMQQGVGLLCAHYAVEVPADKGGPKFLTWIGGYYEDKWSCNPMWLPEYKDFPDHPITRGVQPFTLRDEWYFNMRFRPDMEGVTPILSAKPSDDVRDGPYVWPQGPYDHIVANSGREEVMMWAVERPDGGRGVGFTGGHFHKNWGDGNFIKAVLNAMLWVAGAEVPENGVDCTVSEEELALNLDPKN